MGKRGWEGKGYGACYYVVPSCGTPLSTTEFQRLEIGECSKSYETQPFFRPIRVLMLHGEG